MHNKVLLDVHFHSKFQNKLNILTWKENTCKGGGRSYLRLFSQEKIIKTFRQMSYDEILHKYCRGGGKGGRAGWREGANPVNSEKALSFQVFAFL